MPFSKKLNAEGGINGRKIDFISYDDSFQPGQEPWSRRASSSESDEVLLIFQSLGHGRPTTPFRNT